MDELLEQFLIEGRELVAQAGKDLSALARDPRDAAAIDSAFRAIHTLKGSFGVFALAPAERLLHAAEDMLDRARRDAGVLDGGTVAALVACLDQTDRWIDDMERSGALPDDAERVSTASTALLKPAASPAKAGAEPSRPAEWVEALKTREADLIAQAGAALVVFRYAPDAECFFRGEDPLVVAEAVPGLLALAVLPTGGDWPGAEELEPFSCFSVLEGLSTSSLEEVQAAFRMQPDQVQLARIEPTAAEKAPGEARGDATLRVDAARLDALADGLGDLIVAINALAPLAAEAQQVDRALAARIRAAQAGIEGVTAKLHRNLAAVRMVPLEPVLRRLPRMAREIAETLGKRVSLSISGEGIEVDKQVADGLFEPLLHLLRNALDHGIESPDDRAAAGKPPEGAVSLSFRRDGDRITATLRDDGAGMDPGRIRQAAVARGLLAADAAAALSEAAALQLIFLPGFSTAGTVTEVSGRGVGMDAVRAAVEKLRGTIEIDSARAQGTAFHIHLPVNALTTRLLVVEVAGERYGVALDQVVETVRVDRAALLPVGTGLACVLRDRTVPVLDLAELLDAQAVQGDHAKLVVTRSRGEPVALRVDAFAERIDTVLRPPGGLLASARGVIGSALMGDGGVLLVLDLPELAA
ncbi:MAG TPA: chemotaxis protein CheA [Novosphingobium sp.]|nr:chemotaxis protein CheA [Novosphingobium sp.]